MVDPHACLLCAAAGALVTVSLLCLGLALARWVRRPRPAPPKAAPAPPPDPLVFIDLTPPPGTSEAAWRQVAPHYRKGKSN